MALLIETSPAGTDSVFEILQTHDRNSVHITAEHPRHHNRWGLYPDCSMARQKAQRSWVRSASETRPLTSPGDITLFLCTIVSGRVRLLSFIISHYKLFRNTCMKFAHVTQSE